MSVNHLQIAVLLIMATFLVRPNQGLAQINYRFSQYQQNLVPLNPSFSGIDDFVDIKLGYRTQWAGFENAPTNMYLSGNLALRISPGNSFKDRGVRLFEANAYNEKETDDEFGYRKGNRHGVGFYLLQNKEGGFDNLAGYMTYAYHLRFTNQLIWSVGISVGYEFNKFDPTGITVLNPTNDPTYLSYLANKNQKSNININLGTVFYHRQFYLGYSIINAASFNISGTNSYFNEQVSGFTHSIQFGYRYKWKYGYLISPGILVKIKPEKPTEIIASLKARIHDKVWAGVHYAYLGAVGLSFGTYLTNNIGFNYAYEFPTSQINRATAGSHEIILAIKLNNKNFSRAYLW
jgi:type IX secretion system PorP/SprF family membrane protein